SSVTITKLDDELKKMLDMPCYSWGLKQGEVELSDAEAAAVVKDAAVEVKEEVKEEVRKEEQEKFKAIAAEKDAEIAALKAQLAQMKA
ncbi:MAG: hypothetical protein Q4F31_07475, partial [Eubacteriales bacterium]|nr:hypothetical protein [Eubacteriales bacterium]